MIGLVVDSESAREDTFALVLANPTVCRIFFAATAATISCIEISILRFLRAQQQINQWKAWFLSDQNKSGFLATVSAVQVPQHMARNPTYNKYVLVFDRGAEYAGNEDRRRLVKAAETDDFKIITFDSLAEGLSQKQELTVGSRHNQFIDILADEITDAGMYAWMEPTQLRVSKALHERLRKGGSNHFVLGDDSQRQEALSRAASLVRVRPN
ncbi:hypothetical protein [Bradyrhizobium sp. Cp5.3]|uniref:hypothetical protein n=1 Tax=Bradyrhizobium sp. Cp5.3 TaxID=443598 RepID=UPI0012EB2670|nr:hypothetical protein [Bradyrhizobium sp. Cp5.3]